MENLKMLDYTKTDLTDLESEISTTLKISLSEGLNKGGVLSFQIVPDSQHFTDLSSSLLKVSGMVVDGDGNEVGPGAEVMLDAGGVHSLFSSCEVYLNGELASAMTAYPYTATLARYLGCTRALREAVWDTLDGTWDYSEMQVGKSDAARQDATFSPVFNSKQDRIAGSNVVLFGRVFADILTSSRQLLPPGIGITITLRRAPDRFSLVVPDNDHHYSFKMSKASLYMKRIKLRTSIHQKMINNIRSGATLTFNRLETRIMPINAGKQFTWLNCLQGAALPNRIYLALVQQKSLFGTYSQFSTYLENGNLASIRILLNGHTLLADPVEVRFETGTDGNINTRDHYTHEGFLSVVEVLNQVSDLASPLRYNHAAFLRGYTLYAFELGKCGQKIDGGALDLEV